MARCPLFGRYQGESGSDSDVAKPTRLTPNRHAKTFPRPVGLRRTWAAAIWGTIKPNEIDPLALFSRLLRIHQHEQDTARLRAVINPSVICCLLHDHIAFP